MAGLLARVSHNDAPSRQHKDVRHLKVGNKRCLGTLRDTRAVR